MKYIILLIIFFSGLLLRGNEHKMVSDAVMDSLVAEADAVVISEKIVVKILDENDLEFRVRRKIRINNKDGKKAIGTIIIGESDFHSVSDIEAVLKNLDGEIIKELEDEDILESSMISDYYSYNNEKVKYFELFHDRYPYTIDYSFRIQYETHFFWPDWYPQWSIPNLESSYTVILEKDVIFKYYTIGIDIEPKEMQINSSPAKLWQIQNIPPREIELYMRPEDKRNMAVLFSPISFQLGSSRGSFESWDDMAKWYRELAVDKYELNEKTKQIVLDLVKDIEDPYDKIRILYKYMGDKTHYVAKSPGLDGWRPHTAESAHNNGYGDCKDLSTLMVAMLNVSGIKAYPALALTRSDGAVLRDFPSNQFNHCITFVPLKDDTLWLECTADNLDIEDMPYTIEDINALVIKEDRGELIRTPIAPAKSNIWSSIIRGELTQNGSVSVSSRIETTGKQKNTFKSIFKNYKPDEERIKLQKMFSRHLPNLTLNDYKLTRPEKIGQPLTLDYNGEFSKAFSMTKKRIFLNPNVYNRETSDDLPDEDDEIRDYPIHFSYPYMDADTVYLDLKQLYKLESAPDALLLEEPFARYSMNYRFENGVLFYVRFIEYRTNLIPKDQYSAFVKFMKKVIKTDKSKFVFKRSVF